MRESVHDSLVKFRVNAVLVARVREMARSQHKTPSEFMRDVLREKTAEDA